MPAEERAARVPVSGGSIEHLVLRGGPGTPLVVLGGVETGLRHLAGTERMLAQRWASRRRARTVVVLGRPLADRAADVASMGHPRRIAESGATAVEQIGLPAPIAVEAESGGGRISLWLAVDHPRLVDRLVLSSVASETPPRMDSSLGRWLELGEAGRWADFFADVAVALRPAGAPPPATPAAGQLVPAPATPERFIAELRATLDPSSFVTNRLHEITAPALVLAGGRDLVVPPEATRAVAERMPNARFDMDPECGHAVRTSFRNYDRLVEEFLAGGDGPAVD